MAARNSEDRNIVRQLTICGAILTVGYIVLFGLLQAPAFWYDLRPDPSRSLISEFFGPINAAFPQWWVNLKRTDSAALTTVPIYVLMVGLITLPFLYILRRVSRSGSITPERRKALLRRIFAGTVVIMLVLLFERGLLSSDIYNYAWYSRIWVDFSASPYTHAPAGFPADPEGSIYWIGWPKEMAVYGPAWMLLSAPTYKLSQLIGGTFAAQIFSFRLLADVAHLLNAWLIWSIMGLILSRRHLAGEQAQLKRWKPRSLKVARPSHLRSPVVTAYSRLRAEPAAHNHLGVQFAALLFYIWNPVLLVEFAGNGHNDVVMLTFILAAVWLHLKGTWPLAALALALAALVKLPALLLLPGYLWLLLWNRDNGSKVMQERGKVPTGIRRVALAGGIILLTCVVLYVPFWEGTRTLAPLFTGPANRFYLHTLAADVRTNLPMILANVQGVTANREQYIEGVQQFLDSNLRLWLMGVLGLVALLVTWRARTFKGMMAAWGWVMVVAIMTQGWFWPWYVSWAVVPAALSQSRRLLNTTLLFSISSLFLYLEEQILGQRFTFFLDWSGMLLMGLPLAYLLGSLLLELRRKKRPTILVRRRITARPSRGLGDPERAL